MQTIPLVDLQRQYQDIRPDIDAAVAGVIGRGAFVSGREVTEFEQAFARACGTGFGIGTSCGTSALYLALRALGIGRGDEVVTVPNTFIATTEAVGMTGARPVFVDIDEKTYNMAPSRLEAAITPKTRAVIPVHLYGQPADMAAIAEIAKSKGIAVIEDAAQAHLAEFEGRPVGRLGDAACFSFFPAKNLGAFGDAGMVVTDNEDLARKIKMLSDHGRTEKYTHEMEGFNFRLDTLQAAVLNVKLRHLPQWIERRQAIAQRYDQAWAGKVVTPFVDPRARHVYHQYVIRVPDRDQVRDALARKGIATGIHYPIPLHRQPAYQSLGYGPGAFPVAERCAGEILSVPVFPELTDAEVEHIIQSVAALGDGRE